VRVCVCLSVYVCVFVRAALLHSYATTIVFLFVGKTVHRDNKRYSL